LSVGSITFPFIDVSRSNLLGTLSHLSKISPELWARFQCATTGNSDKTIGMKAKSSINRQIYS